MCKQNKLIYIKNNPALNKKILWDYPTPNKNKKIKYAVINLKKWMELVYKIYRKLVSFYITSLHKWRDNRCEYSILQGCRSIPSKSINVAQFHSISQLGFSYKNMSNFFEWKRAFEVKF